jgi:transcription initiation factor IIE alpha subunit
MPSKQPLLAKFVNSVLQAKRKTIEKQEQCRFYICSNYDKMKPSLPKGGFSLYKKTEN